MATNDASDRGGQIQLPPAVVNTAALRFYATHFKSLVMSNLIALLVIGGMFGWHVFTERRDVERVYFGIDFKTGRMVRLVPLSEPYLSTQSMLTHVQECIQNANTYDFVNFKRNFNKSSLCFTDEGWNAFATELERVGTLKSVLKHRLVAQAVATGVPVVISQPIVLKGILTWEVQMPVRISFQGGEGGTGLAMQNLMVTVTLQRLPEWQNEHGMGISQYIAKARRE